MPTISCTEFSRQFAEAIERRESLNTTALREHAGACAECGREWLDAMVVDRAVAHWKKPMPAAGLTDRILAQLASEAAVGSPSPLAAAIPERGHGRTSSRSRRRLTRSAGVAAAVTALALLAIFLLGRPARPVNVEQPEIAKSSPPVVAAPAPTVGTNHEPVAKPAPPARTGMPVELMVADAGSAYLHLAGNAAKAVTAATVLVPPAADTGRQTAPLPKGREPWVNDVRREIAPVTHQLSHAFEFLIQAVPENRAPAT
ncbi:MAG TPA: hypothetical protein VGX78_00720 [Pirellulales bacterium]|jgi:hypothetical protein|nr:hypothetical protein [Pirellulales bacterium]